jgi:peptidoglycan/LPS O-acetylase OafA/YrhL
MVPTDSPAPIRSSLRTRGNNFRPDIEGLRAVAVLAVVLYHLKFSWMPGGFIGVDIFFTISGFLMAEIIAEGLRRGKFNPWQFYQRRFLRIWPAMLLVMLATFAAGFVLLLPLQLIELAKATSLSLLLASNILFWAQSGYFAPAAENNLLLHLWSLAVEQQFYVVMPPMMLMIFAGRPRDWRWLVVAGTIASLLLCIYFTPRIPVATFYLLPFRIWEFLLGSSIALYHVKRQFHWAYAEIASAVGMAMIVAAAVFLNGTLRYPGFWALLPCVGAGLVIGANVDTPSRTSRWLALPPCVAIGRMSYSIYLWHWPIITYCRLSGVPIDSLSVQLSIAVATLGCSYLSWKFVEVQFRNSAMGSVRLRLAGLASVAFALGTISATVMLTDGLPARLDAPTSALLAYQNYPVSALYREGECFLRLRQSATDFHEARCGHRVSGRATLLLWGDSHAAHLAPGLREASTKFGINIVQATYAGCAPIPSRSSNSGECANFGKNILKLALTEKFDAIVLSANWTGYPSILPELLTVIAELVRNQRFVIVIGPTAEFNNALPLLLAGKRKGTTPIPFSPPEWLSDAAVELDRRMGEMFGELPNVAYLSPISEVCPSRVCPVLLDNNVPLVWDSTHLTAEGSRLVSNLLLNRISSVIRAQRREAERTNL